MALPLQVPCSNFHNVCFSFNWFSILVVFLKKGVVSLLRELPPSKRRRSQPLLLVTQRQVPSIIFWLLILTFLSSQSYSLLSQFGQYLYPIPLCSLAIVPVLVILNHFLFIFRDLFKVVWSHTCQKERVSFLAYFHDAYVDFKYVEVYLVH